MPPIDWGQIGQAVALVVVGVALVWRELKPSVRAEREQSERIRKRDRRRLRRSWDWGDEMDEWTHQRRMERRRHDEEHHPSGEGAIGNAELPPNLARGIRAYASAEDEEQEL